MVRQVNFNQSPGDLLESGDEQENGDLEDEDLGSELDDEIFKIEDISNLLMLRVSYLKIVIFGVFGNMLWEDSKTHTLPQLRA